MFEGRIMQRMTVGLGMSLFAVLLLSLPWHSYAGEVNVFGPKVYEKGKGKPITYSESFSAAPGLTDFRFLVTNGPDGAGEVKNVSISLNGVTIVSPSDLKSSGSTQQILSFPIQADNLLEITLKGQGGNAVSVHLAAVAPSPVPEDEPVLLPGDGLFLDPLVQ